MAGHADAQTLKHYLGFDVALTMRAIRGADRVLSLADVRGEKNKIGPQLKR